MKLAGKPRVLLLSLALLLAGLQLRSTSRWIGAQEPAHQQASQEETAVADEPPQSAADKLTRLNLPTKTGGGTQLWTDHLYRDGYRIQQHALTGHWRLLDSGDVRRGWGSREHCEALLNDLAPPVETSDQPQHYVVLLHGLMRTHHCMKPLQTAFTQQGEQHVLRFAYASTRCSIADHGSALRELLEGLPENSQISFVGHSMGNIVVRHALGQLQAADDPRGVLPRCQSMVMLGPPNQGAAIARRLAPTGVYGLVTGKGGLELGPNWDVFVSELAIPEFPFLIVAGDLSEARLQNPLLSGSNDFIVGVEEARLDGAVEVKTVPVLHSFLMKDPDVSAQTVQFIQQHRRAD